MDRNYPAFVFDPDGTLVGLILDWRAVAAELASVLETRGLEPPESLWEMLEAAGERDCRPAVEAVICWHERDGAADSTPVPEGSVGVCSPNSEAACRRALAEHGIEGIDAVAGRDTVRTEKPDPEPLSEAIRRLDGDLETATFVGDAERDATAPERVGVD